MQSAARRSPTSQLRVVAHHGARLADHVPASDIAETKLYVSFSGLTEAEQRAAIAGFPGGSRFILVPEAS